MISYFILRSFGLTESMESNIKLFYSEKFQAHRKHGKQYNKDIGAHCSEIMHVNHVFYLLQIFEDIRN